MKKRLRKKLHLGEFQEMCFAVRLTFASPEESTEGDAFWYKPVTAVEANNLLILGMADDFCIMTDFYKMPDGLWKTATENDRHFMKDWLERQPEVQSFTVGPLANAWRIIPQD
ncbi:50S ribosome-binding protein YggL [Hymenobacter sp. ASUV-10]|uniref:50S ribosome-binding protein YggL n=1 Tax=Hymenobacter aranciens TaxID=3063996 RepID=A0ABT9BF37_9BACT|nr:50S ribosome-binding protein YggL [Hymenobacter sp. ASUV-10]MDO7876870.1 50S ribosome-binding protein YggL [Hymenobacter sp. ASUV-10]